MTTNAVPAARASLVGAHVKGSTHGTSLLVCEYAGASAKFEILSQNGACAPYIDVE
jgi:hypothetical protein